MLEIIIFSEFTSVEVILSYLIAMLDHLPC